MLAGIDNFVVKKYEPMSEFNDIQKIKRRFFAMRNGVTADVLRRNGSPFRIIFGLNLPQISDIAAETGVNDRMARQLWANASTRESMLLAPMLMDLSSLTVEFAMRLAKEAPAAEVADNLCHKLLRKMPDSFRFALGLAEEADPMSRYCAMRLLWHHIREHKEAVKAVAQCEIARGDRLTRRVAAQIVEEIDYLDSEVSEDDFSGDD